RTILTEKHLELTVNRLCCQLIEKHDDFSSTALVGIQPRGIHLSERIYRRLTGINNGLEIEYGKLDITFYRDDFRRREDPLKASATDIDFLLEGKRVVLIDDVLFTGRTIRAALDALLDFGRPECIELLVLIDRRFSRHVPVQPDYVGRTVDSVASERVDVKWKETEGEDRVVLYTPDEQ
ncbi:MAG: bifunctional pyr operon transcriptional regulator/uracil phosphoribosyltransferase PyrR, partial [Flavobacteriales bacterium]